MIICEFKDGQGLGNQLWNYATARSISDKLSMDFKVLGYQYYKGHGFLNIDKGSSAEVEEYLVFYEALYYDKELKYLASGYDDNVLKINGNTKLEGLFQSEKYFYGNINRIKSYFNTSTLVKNTKITSETCVLNIRGGEYKLHKKFLLPKEYWVNAVNLMKRMYKINNFIIVTDDKKYARTLFPNLEIISDDIHLCFSSLFHSKYIIVSNSTFAYFPIKLSSEKKIVFAPKYWARYNNIYNRWASPANFYEDWFWLSKDGLIENSLECKKIAEDTEKHYKNTFHIHYNELFYKKNYLFFLSNKTKIKIKNILSHIFPKHIG